MMDWFAPVWLVTKRELRDQLRDWRILFPLIVLTLLFPLLMNEVAKSAVEFVGQYGGTLLIDRLVPFSVLIIGFFPITISLVVALESFVGEKERGTIEPLLSTPLKDWHMYVGKLLIGVLTPLFASMLAIGFYLIIVSRQQIAMPDLSVLIQLLALTIAHAVLMVSAAIVISVQSTSVKAANLLASFIVIPVAVLMQGESALLFWGNNQVLWLAVAGVLILAGLLIRVGLSHFQREYLLGPRDRCVGFSMGLAHLLGIFQRRFKIALWLVQTGGPQGDWPIMAAPWNLAPSGGFYFLGWLSVDCNNCSRAYRSGFPGCASRVDSPI